MPKSSEEIWPVTVFTVVAIFFCSSLLALRFFRNQALLALLLQLQLGDRDPVHLVRSIGQPQGSRSRPEASERNVVRDAGPTKGLDSTVKHPQSHVRGDDLYHGDLRLRLFVALRVHHMSGLQGE